MPIKAKLKSLKKKTIKTAAAKKIASKKKTITAPKKGNYCEFC